MTTKLGFCGHTYEADHTYSGFCPDCETKVFGNMVNLEGSEKQVTWANDIRQGAAQAIAKRIGNAVGGLKSTELTNKVGQVSSAKFWIDNRNNDASGFLKAVRDNA